MQTTSKVLDDNSLQKFQCKIEERRYFKPTIENVSLQEMNIGNGVRIVN